MEEILEILDEISERSEGLISQALVVGSGCIKKDLISELEATLYDIKRLKTLLNRESL